MGCRCETGEWWEETARVALIPGSGRKEGRVVAQQTIFLLKPI